MSIVVGTLTIDLTANTASFSQSMDKMSQLSAKSASDIKRSLEKIALAGLAMATAVAGGVTAMIKGALDSADAMSKMAQSAGTTTETLSVLTYAAGLSNVSTEALAKGLEKLSVAAFKAQNGNVQLERVFARLGVGVTDANGKLKDSGQLMQELSVRFAKIGDSSGKTALAIALFGKAGAAMIPLLNQYGSEQEKVNEEAHSFGLILSTSTTEVAARAHDNLERLGAVLKGIGFSILGATLPALDSLLERIVQIAKDANIPDLARAFGEKVTTAVTLLGKALDFAASHAHALKLALEALAAIQLAKIAIPIIGDLAAGGLANVSKGLDKATIGLLGLQRTIPVLAKFGTWVSETAQFIALLATEEGLASAATYVLGGAFVAVGGWVGIAVGAVVGLGVALYKFRDANFEIADSTYKLRDAWTAAGGAISKAFGWLATDVETHLANIRKIWTEFANWFSANPIVSELSKVASKLLSLEERFAEAQRKFAERLIPQGAIDALNQAKKQRQDEESIRPFLGLIKVPEKAAVKKPAPDTAGLGKPQNDPFGEEIRKLDEAIAAQKAYLGVLDGTAEAIAKVTAEEKANAIILQIKNKLVSEGRLGANQSLPASQQTQIQQRVATEESIKSLVDYGREIVGQQHSTDLATQQARALAAANLEGDAAIRRVTVDNAVLALSYNKTAEQIKAMTPELAKLQSELTIKANVELVAVTNRDIDGLRDELAQRELITGATLESVDVQRQAALSSKLYSINQQIADTADEQAHEALIAKRDALIDVTKAEWAAVDAQAALSLRSPTEQYKEQADDLNHAVEALAELQGGITYGQSLQIATRQEEQFNRATDETISLLLNEGSAADGVTAFFLKMQEQGKSTATILYDAFSQAFDKISQGFTDVITAQNHWQRNQAWNQFAQLFHDVGKSLLNNTIKSGLQSGLGAVGKAFHIDLSAVGKKFDGSSPGNALWVRMASSTGSALTGLGAGSSSTSGDSSGILGGILSALGIKSKQGQLGESLGLPTSIPQPSSPTNELDDLLGIIPGASQIALGGGGSTTPASGASGIFSGILSNIFGSKQGALGGESLGLPTSIPRPSTPTNELDNLLGNQSDPASGILAIAKKVLTPTLPTSPDGAPSGGANELEGLLGLTPSAATTTPGSSLNADQLLIPETPILNPPDVQAQTQTLITRPEPSMWQGLLGSVIGAGAKLLPMLGFAGGGKVSGPGTAKSDSIPARLSHGEFVVNAASTAKFLPMLQQINDGESPTRVVGRSSSKAASYGLPVRMAFGGRAVMPSVPSYSSTPAHKPFASTRGGGASAMAFRRAFANGGFVSMSQMQFDDGGFVSPSSAYESSSGRDFMSAAAERIVSNSYSNQSHAIGDNHTWTIDARGSNDPAQTTAHLDRYMLANGPKIAAAALHAQKDQQLRRAPSAR